MVGDGKGSLIPRLFFGMYVEKQSGHDTIRGCEVAGRQQTAKRAHLPIFVSSELGCSCWDTSGTAVIKVTFDFWTIM